jgi:hypothetical protein
MYNYQPNQAQKLNTQPLMSISAAETITYQFQVVEYMKDDKVMKVELQVQATNHDAQGNVVHSSGFIPVPRISLPFVEYSK